VPEIITGNIISWRTFIQKK